MVIFSDSQASRFLIFGNNFLYADVGSGAETNHSEANQQNILPENPIESTPARSLVVGDNFDDRWEHETQRTQAHSTNEANERTKLRNGHSNGDG